ncbi:MAG: hypothetical protein MUF18_20090 [Fimbriiglobus sp.]|nr:hypothetical protein [Fimbriiglobus sp.]
MQYRTCLRVGGCILVGGVVFAGTDATYPGGAQRLVADVRDYSYHSQDLAESTQHGERLSAKVDRTNDRILLKQEICRQLAGGLIRLDQAAETYLLMLGEDPRLLERFREVLPGESDVERVAVSILRDVLATSPSNSTNRQSLLDQFRVTYGRDYPSPPLDPVGEPPAEAVPRKPQT